MFQKHIKQVSFYFILILVSTIFSGCILVRGFFYESGGTVFARSLPIVRTSGFALTEASAIRATARTGVAGGRVVGVSSLPSRTMVLELRNIETAMGYFNRVRIGRPINNHLSLYIVEEGKSLEVARALGVTRRGETIVQFFSEGRAISKAFSMPGRLYSVARNKARLYTGRGLHYRVYHWEMEQGTPVFVLEEVKNGWVYVQYQNSRGYIPIAELALIALMDYDENQKSDSNNYYEVDENGKSEICFVNTTKETVAVVFAQRETDDIREFGPGDNVNPVVLINSQESYCFNNLPVSLRYAYHVYKIPQEVLKYRETLISFMEYYFDKGELKIYKDETLFYFIKDDNPIPPEALAGINDNTYFLRFNDKENKGLLGFKNYTNNRISVFLSHAADNLNPKPQADRANFKGPELIVRPGDTKYFYWLKPNTLYNYSVFTKDDRVNRNFVLETPNSFIDNSDISISSESTIINEIGKLDQNSTIPNSIKNNELYFLNKTGKTIAVFLCNNPLFGCSAGNQLAQWVVLKNNESKTFRELSDTRYQYATYYWDETTTRFDVFLEERLIEVKEFKSLSENPKSVVLSNSSQKRRIP